MERLRKGCYFTALKLLDDLNAQFCVYSVNLHILPTAHNVPVWEHGYFLDEKYVYSKYKTQNGHFE